MALLGGFLPAPIALGDIFMTLSAALSDLRHVNAMLP